jgi:CubicO group peptidase (beta-lactamase class C family)
MLHPCYSVTKSFTSALIGIAIDQGYINGVDDNLLDFFPEYEDIANLDDTKKSIMLKHVLTMSAGFTWDEISNRLMDRQGNLNPDNDAIKMAQSDDWNKYVLDRPMSTDPGTEWNYSSGGSHLLSGILTNTTGQSAEEFAEEHLFKKLGITKWEWLADPNGLTTTGWGLELHPVNMAMFGYLYLKKGRLNGQQVVPEAWVEESTAKHIVVEHFFHWIMDGKLDYGYQWFRLNDSMFDTMWRDDPPDINDIFDATGVGGQYIYVVPHLDLVIVITAWELQRQGLPSMLFTDCYNAVKEK